MSFLVFKGRTESVKCDGIRCGVDEFNLILYVEVKEDGVFELASEMRNVLNC